MLKIGLYKAQTMLRGSSVSDLNIDTLIKLIRFLLEPSQGPPVFLLVFLSLTEHSRHFLLDIFVILDTRKITKLVLCSLKFITGRHVMSSFQGACKQLLSQWCH